LRKGYGLAEVREDLSHAELLATFKDLDDLALWDRAIHDGKPLKEASDMPGKRVP
jgi:hypothetical protein